MQATSLHLSPGYVKAGAGPFFDFASPSEFLSPDAPVPVFVLVPFFRNLAGSLRSASTGGPKVPDACFFNTAAPIGCVVPKAPDGAAPAHRARECKPTNTPNRPRVFIVIVVLVVAAAAAAIVAFCSTLLLPTDTGHAYEKNVNELGQPLSAFDPAPFTTAAEVATFKGSGNRSLPPECAWVHKNVIKLSKEWHRRLMA